MRQTGFRPRARGYVAPRKCALAPGADKRERGRDEVRERDGALAAENLIPKPELGVQVSPWRTGARDPKNRFEKATVVVAAPTGIAETKRRRGGLLCNGFWRYRACGVKLTS